MPRSLAAITGAPSGYTFTEFHDVMGMDRNTVSRSMWMGAEEVVATSLRRLDSGKIIVVPGWRYKLICTLLKLLPARAKRAIGLRASERRNAINTGRKASG